MAKSGRRSGGRSAGRFRALWAAAFVFSLAAGVGIAFLRAPRTIEIPEGPESSIKPPPASRPAPARPATPAPPDLAAVPPGVDAEQWTALCAEYAGQPAELRRLAAFFAYADLLQRFRAGRDPAAAHEALARALAEGLDEHLRRRELSGGEASLVKKAVLEVLVADEAERSAEFTRWQASWRGADDGVRVAREAEFQRRQAAIVAAWTARPAGQRDAAALERELEALRHASFDDAKTNAAGGQR